MPGVWVVSLFLEAGSLNNRNLFLSSAAWKCRLGCYQGWGLGRLTARGYASCWASYEEPHPFRFEYKRLPQAHVYEHVVPNE